MRKKFEDFRPTELPKPLAIVTNLCLFDIDDFPRLCKIMLHIPLYIFFGKRRPGPVAARRVANPRGKIANNKDSLMPQFLKLSQFMEHNCVAQMKIGRRGINTKFHAELLRSRKRFCKMVFVDYFLDVSGQKFLYLFFFLHKPSLAQKNRAF